MSVYNTLCELAEKHTKVKGGGYSDTFSYDLKEKSIRSKGKYIVKNGHFIIEQIVLETDEVIDLTGELLADHEMQMENQWEVLQQLYDSYLYSRPCVCSGKSNFKAKTSDELTFEQLINGESRNVAKCRLEAFIILGAICRIFEWSNPQHWFWKGKNGLIIYRDWLL